jgi:hypothetical protein
MLLMYIDRTPGPLNTEHHIAATPSAIGCSEHFENNHINPEDCVLVTQVRPCECDTSFAAVIGHQQDHESHTVQSTVFGAHLYCNMRWHTLACHCHRPSYDANTVHHTLKGPAWQVYPGAMHTALMLQAYCNQCCWHSLLLQSSLLTQVAAAAAFCSSMTCWAYSREYSTVCTAHVSKAHDRALRRQHLRQAPT